MHQVRGQRELLLVAKDGAGGSAEAKVRILSLTLSCASLLMVRKL